MIKINTQKNTQEYREEYKNTDNKSIYEYIEECFDFYSTWCHLLPNDFNKDICKDAANNET